jgi:hypothetical protein
MLSPLVAMDQPGDWELPHAVGSKIKTDAEQWQNPYGDFLSEEQLGTLRKTGHVFLFGQWFHLEEEKENNPDFLFINYNMLVLERTLDLLGSFNGQDDAYCWAEMGSNKGFNGEDIPITVSLRWQCNRCRQRVTLAPGCHRETFELAGRLQTDPQANIKKFLVQD